ncbi:uncharacterized protein LOC114527183 [Dendronephthya gigantea]|uniref:uncharacterized protein LOC114527183 n=1 Tax=Dendronephthya gigantea TaxID=151771 RepID=UPI001069E886|nr:uncharacterized protein LOC114527183 [Dendronephthya gigantea]
MVSFSYQGLAIRWTFFFMMSSAIVYEEYTTLYFNQLGLSTSAVGLALLFAIPFLPLVPVLGLLGDKYRARKLIFIISIVVFIILTLAPLLPLFVNFNLCVGKQSRTLSLNQTSAPEQSFYSENDSNQFQKRFAFASNKSLSPVVGIKSRRQSKRKDKNPGVHSASEKAYSATFSVLFVYVAIVKTCFVVVERVLGSLLNVATVTYLKKERANYGSFYFWAQIGAGISLLVAGLLASKLKYVVCQHVEDGYFVVFYLTALATTLSFFAMPWIKFEYLEKRVIDWDEVKNILKQGHYQLMLVLGFYFGCCFAYQHHWEYYYIAELNGGPTVMGIGGIIRRPFVAIWFMLSGQLIKRVGELQTMAFTVFIYGAAMLSLSLITIPWLVLVVDVFQSAGFAFSYSALTVHFSKAASKSSAGVIQGLSDMVFAFGNEFGAGGIGIFFSAVGPKATLLGYAIVSAVILGIYLVYLQCKKDQLDYYERIQDSDSENENG